MSANLRRVLTGATLCVLTLSAARADDIKPALRGLVSMGAYRFVASGGDPVNTLEPLDAKPGIFGGLVVVATWKRASAERLVPSSATTTSSTARSIRARLQRAQPGEAARGQASRLGRLRGAGLGEGRSAATPIDVVHNDKPRVLGRFWSALPAGLGDVSGAARRALSTGEPLIREVAITSCMSFTAEPFFVPIEDTRAGADARRRLHRRGLRDCLDGRARRLRAVEGDRGWCFRSIRCGTVAGRARTIRPSPSGSCMPAGRRSAPAACSTITTSTPTRPTAPADLRRR